MEKLIPEKFKTMIQANCDIKVNPIKVGNPQLNSILEWVYQIIEKVKYKFKVQDMAVDDENPWDRLLA